MSGPILVTGATGFVGRHVLRALLRSGRSLRLTARRGSQRTIVPTPGIERIFETSDLFSATDEWLAETLRGVDTLVHLAWHVNAGDYLESPRNLDCHTGTVALAHAAIRAGVRRVVGIGTCFEYELGADFLTVDHPLRPNTPYAEAKAATFRALTALLGAHAVEFAWCRLFSLFGDGEDERRLAAYVRAQLSAGLRADLTRGDQIRDYLDVREAAAAIAAVVLGNWQGPINICSGVPMTVREFAERIADEYGRRDLLGFGARPERDSDPLRVVGVRTLPRTEGGDWLGMSPAMKASP